MHFKSLIALALGALGAVAAGRAAAAEPPPGLQACRLQGVETDAWCGRLRRPLNPADPNGRQIDLHFAVLPALARNKKPDPVFFFAGGPGQSAIALAGSVARLLGRLSNRRDLVLIDQRGTGRSAALDCDEGPPTQPLAEAADPTRQDARWRACLGALQRLPHGDLRWFTTSIAMQDADAVRQALGVERVNLVGGSYGTRAALEYMRQFPQQVRRAVIDGVAPPDMALPDTFSPDAQAAVDAMLAACAADTACRTRYPALRSDWQNLLQSLPREVSVTHPVTATPETLRMGRDMLLGLVRIPLYAPALSAGLPLAVTEAARGRFEPLVGLASAQPGGKSGRLAQGMHYAVICAEDAPRMAGHAAGVARRDPAGTPGADFGSSFADQYRRACAGWAAGAVPPAFYSLPAAPAATLLLSGGVDPVTPPRHAQRVAQALGAKARHVVVAQAGHGVMALGCMRDAVFRFIDAASDADALQVDADCARGVPRPPVFVPVAAAAPTGAWGARR